MTPNHTLEIVNNLATINRFILVVYLLKFLFTNRYEKPFEIDKLITPNIHRHVVCLTIALIIDKLGALIVGITVWLWRAMGIGGGAGAINISSIPGMVTGSLLMAFGTLLLIRILSINKYGSIIWQGTLILDLIYLGLEVL